ncbi:MAG: dprA [Acidobacteria bacterium]|nr:dprA [Acidobacteriota bacterium]
MNDVSLRDLCIAYALLPFLTPARTRLLLEWFDPLTNALNVSNTVLRQLLAIDAEQAQTVRNPLRTGEARELLARVRDCAIAFCDDAFPPLLREISDPPLALFFRGDASLLQRPSIAVVGSRRASPYALNASRHLATQLSSAGLSITSGLALGVDAAAHTAALDCGGATIAVLGTGIDVIYPRANRKLFAAIAERGVIVTEFAPSTPPKREHFPIRNRVISGLTLGTVIVEATSRSGSLITARMAAEQNREVFAVPGSIFSAGAEGPNRLIQYGAKLVHDVDDILVELPGEFRAKVAETKQPDEPLREVLAAFQRDDATHIDDAAARLGRSVAALSEAVLQLELGGWLQAVPGARYMRTMK